MKRLLTDLNDNKESSVIHLISGLSAGIITATCTNPIWVIKTRLQLQEKAYASSLDCFKKLVATDGYRGLYKGISASYLGALEGTIQWLIYERLKLAIQPTAPEERAPSWVSYLLIGGLAKFSAALATYPHEVLRTRLRQESVKYQGIVDCAHRIYYQEGWRSFYGGITPHLMRVVPNSAIMFLCFEAIVHTMHKTFYCGE